MTPDPMRHQVGKCAMRHIELPVCDECVLEAWERMTYGGLHVNPAHRITAAVPIGRGADGHAMIWELWHAPR